MEMEIGSSLDESCANAGSSYVYYSIPHFSEEEAEALAKRLDNDETFNEAMKFLITWLQRGECNERNSACFYFLIRQCWDRVEKLQAEEKEYREKIKSLKKSVSRNSSCIQLKLAEIEETFSTIEKQNLWICFTQDHLEKLQEMRSDLLNLKRVFLEDDVGRVLEKESNDRNIEDEQVESNVHEMHAKLDSLTSESDIVYEETEEMQLNYEESKKKIQRPRIKTTKFKIIKKKEYLMIQRRKKPCLLVEIVPQSDIDEFEKHIISLISIFIFECQGRADLNSIYLHLTDLFPNNYECFTKRDIEDMLKRYPNIFKVSRFLSLDGLKKWTCISITPETRAILIEKKLHLPKKSKIVLKGKGKKEEPEKESSNKE